MKEGYHIRKYKRYIYDHSVSVPKSTKLDLNKRSATRSKTAISIPQSVVSTELKAVMPTEESASHKGETFVQETEVTYQTLSPMRRTFVFLGSRCTQPLTPHIEIDMVLNRYRGPVSNLLRSAFNCLPPRLLAFLTAF